jgi:hypothetical protein
MITELKFSGKKAEDAQEVFFFRILSDKAESRVVKMTPRSGVKARSDIEDSRISETC